VGANKGCGFGGKISDSDSNSDSDLTKISDSRLRLRLIKISNFRHRLPPPTFPRFPTPTPYHKGNEIWLLQSMDIVVHSKKSRFQQNFQRNCIISTGISNLGVWSKNDPIGRPVSESDKKSHSDSQCCQESSDSDSGSATLLQTHFVCIYRLQS